MPALRNRNPDPHPQLERLTIEDDAPGIEDVISLVGFVGPRDPEGPLRLYADEEGQRYLEIPYDDFVDAEPLGDERQRTQVWVRRALMTDDTFGDPAPDGPQAEMLQMMQDSIVGPTLSLWQFLPQNRLVAAEMLGMLPDVEWRRYELETGP